MTTAERWRMPEFFAPWPLAAVALMAINDHLLKARLGNALTGKLSDVTLCFFMPLFVSALLGLCLPGAVRLRIVVGALITTAAFTVLEIWPAAADAFCRWMPTVGRPLGVTATYRLTEDVTDLACLALVPVACWYGIRRAELGKRAT